MVPTAKSGPALGLQASALSGNVTGKTDSVKWVFDRTPDVSCPVIYEGLVYLCMNDGRLVCLDQMTGEKKYESRIHNAQYRATESSAAGMFTSPHATAFARWSNSARPLRRSPRMTWVSRRLLASDLERHPIYADV